MKIQKIRYLCVKDRFCHPSGETNRIGKMSQNVTRKTFLTIVWSVQSHSKQRFSTTINKPFIWNEN